MIDSTAVLAPNDSKMVERMTAAGRPQGEDYNHIGFKFGKREIISCPLTGRYPVYSAA